MAIPLEITALIERLNQELSQTEQEAIQGLNLVRHSLSLFPNNILLIQLFAYFTNVLLFVNNSRRRIQIIIEKILAEEVTVDEEIQEAGEDLATLVGVTLEVKIEVERIITRLENWI